MSMILPLLRLLTGLFLCRSLLSEVAGQTVELVDTGVNFNSIAGLVAFKGQLYFGASEFMNPGQYGLWKTDGTPAVTTSLIKTFSGAPTDFIVFRDMLFFSASDESRGREPWKSDGTSAGTVLIKDIRPGPESSMETRTSTISFQDHAFFVANDGASGKQIFMSDGSEAGTRLVTDVNDGPSTITPCTFTLYKDALYFYRFGLYKTDGVDTTPVDSRLRTSQCLVGESYIEFKGDLFLSASRTFGGNYELWKSNGTAEGTMLVKEIYSGTDSSSPSQFASLKDTLLIFAADSEEYGFEPWKSDGTEAGTELLKDIIPGGFAVGSSYPRDFIEFDGAVFFWTNVGSCEPQPLWKTDGTAAGTVIVKEFEGSGCQGSTSEPYFVFANEFYFSALDGNRQCGLWKTDGTAAGTVLVKAGEAFPLFSTVQEMAEVDGRVYLRSGSFTLWLLTPENFTPSPTPANPPTDAPTPPLPPTNSPTPAPSTLAPTFPPIPPIPPPSKETMPNSTLTPTRTPSLPTNPPSLETMPPTALPSVMSGSPSSVPSEGDTTSHVPSALPISAPSEQPMVPPATSGTVPSLFPCLELALATIAGTMLNLAW